jgi:hypothetical protein
MADVEKELCGLVEVTSKVGEPPQAYRGRVLTKLMAIYEADTGDDEWEKLSEGSQNWYNAALDARSAKKKLPGFDGEVEEEDVVVEKTKKTKKAAAKGAAVTKKVVGNGAKDKAAGGRGRKGLFTGDSKVAKVAPENPFRAGSKAHDCFKQYKVGRTVEAILSAGVPRSKLYRHMKRGFVSVAG